MDDACRRPIDESLQANDRRTTPGTSCEEMMNESVCHDASEHLISFFLEQVRDVVRLTWKLQRDFVL
jgi:hypothetical protein